MSSSLISVLLGGRRGADGLYAAHRTILFSTAGQMTVDAMAEHGSVYYVKEADEAALNGAQEIEAAQGADTRAMLEQCLSIADGSDFLIADAPIPGIGAAVIEQLLNSYRQSGAPAIALGGAADGIYHAAVVSREKLESALSGGAKQLSEVVFGAQSYSAAHTAVTGARQAYQAQKELMTAVNFALIDQGVNIFAPEDTYIAPDASIGAGTVILPGTIIRPGCTIGAGCTIGPNSLLEQAHVGDRTTVNSAQIYESSVGSDATVGPFAYIRPGCTVGDRTRIGDFVELKKAQIGNDTKVSHLTYIGDAEVGERVNFGCGTVVVNYDGYVKSKTIIGDDCFIGCNTNLVAPVTLGNRVLTAAATTVTKAVPDGAMAVARVRQENKEGWNDRRRRMHGQSNG
ncbi:MAG: DapH/DapD/GlmU-related protein [Butyricicoccaceae bacterium]